MLATINTPKVQAPFGVLLYLIFFNVFLFKKKLLLYLIVLFISFIFPFA